MTFIMEGIGLHVTLSNASDYRTNGLYRTL